MDNLICFSRCCSRGWKQARQLVASVKERTGVALRIEFLSFSSSQDRFNDRGITLEACTNDPCLWWSTAWASTASHCDEPAAVESLCKLVNEAKEAPP